MTKALSVILLLSSLSMSFASQNMVDRVPVQVEQYGNFFVYKQYDSTITVQSMIPVLYSYDQSRPFIKKFKVQRGITIVFGLSTLALAIPAIWCLSTGKADAGIPLALGTMAISIPCIVSAKRAPKSVHNAVSAYNASLSHQ